MKKLSVIAVALCTVSMIAYGAPSSSSMMTSSVVVEIKAQEYVLSAYNALQKGDEAALKKIEAQIDEYVKTLSDEDQIKFYQAFEKTYVELTSTGKLTKVNAATTESRRTLDSDEMTRVAADYAITLGKVKAEEAIVSGADKASDAIVVGAEKAKAMAEVGAVKAKEAAAKASVVIDEAAVKAEAVYKEAAAKAEEAYKAAAAAVANFGF